jgi:hypothetical protein
MRRTTAAALAIALGALTVLIAATPASAVTSANLIVNGNAETGLCTTSGLDGMTVPGWAITSGTPDTVCYGASGYPSASSPGPSDRGNGFFAGGSTGNATMTQTVDVSSAATAIDGGGVTYSLGAWLGGFSSQNDRAGLSAAFLSASGATLGTASIAPVTNTDRGNTTELLSRNASGSVPAGTRGILVTVTFTYTAGNSTDGYVDDVSLTLSTSVTAPTLAPPPSSVPAFDHVFVVYMENENYAASEAPANSGDFIVGNPSAPYLNNTLAPMGSLLTNMFATTHPSDPNYLALSGGSTFNITTNPAVASVNQPNLGDTVEAAGKTWKGYSESMGTNCNKTNSNTKAGGYYLADDEPFMLYADVANNASRCAAHNQPIEQFNTDLQSAATTPNFVWFAADDFDDMEQGGVSAGDTWLSGELPHIFASPAWTTQRSLLIVTWDEGFTKSFGPSYPNHVAAYIVGSQGLVKAGYHSPARYDQYSLGSTVDHALGLTPLTSNDTYATPLGDVWASGGGGGGGGNPVTVSLTNPNAETGTCSTTTGTGHTPPGWTLTSTPQQICYGASGGFPTAAQGPSTPDTPGNAFFDGGQTASAAMSQTADVSSFATAIDGGAEPYTLSAWLGGFSSQNDRAGVVATFESSSGASLGTASLAPVTAAQRGNNTEMLRETAAGTVPVGTRSIVFTVSFTRASGTEDDGYVDDIAMTLG